MSTSIFHSPFTTALSGSAVYFYLSLPLHHRAFRLR